MDRMEIFIDTRQKHLFEIVKEYYKTHNFDYLHRFDHIARVIWWTNFLSQKEKADLSVTIPSAILHDIALSRVGDEFHAREGSKLCRPFLRKCGYNPKEIEKIAETIAMHSTDDLKFPETKEAKVLFDADKLDTIGPIGIHRWFFEYGRKGYDNYKTVKKTLKHFDKWRKRYGLHIFFTKTAQKIGAKRIVYIEKAFKEILKDNKKFEGIYKEAELE